VSERLKELASKASSLAKPGSWVQIPPSPPSRNVVNSLPYEKAHKGTEARHPRNRRQKDEDIDFSDAPPVLDWSKAEIGKFYRPKKNPSKPHSTGSRW
jgi:hypothetical protein